MTTSPCQCRGPGWCDTHAKTMTAREFSRCPTMFSAFQSAKRRRIEDGDTETLIGPHTHPERCQFRGQKLDVRQCDQCGHRSQKKQVYQCAKFGECSDSEGLTSVVSCRWCQHYSEREPEPIEWPFDRVVCVNLDRRPDRWATFRRNFPGVERVSAVDGWQPDTPAWWGAGGGAWGCRASHVAILRQAVADGLESILILEDDAKPVDNFTAKLRDLMATVPAAWEQLYLGGQHMHGRRPKRIRDGFVRPYNVSRTHAWALHGDGIRRTLAYLEDMDDWSRYPRDHIDHRLGRLHERRGVKVYAADPWLVIQGANHSDIAGQSYGDRGWHLDPPFRPAFEVPRPSGGIRVGWYMPEVAFGGVERWAETLINGFDREKVLPVGIAVDREHDGPTIPMSVPVTTDVGTIAHNSDLVLAWGVQSLAPLRRYFRGPVVAVSHGACDWTAQMLARLAPLADHWAAVSTIAASRFPPPFRDAVEILKNGIGPLELPTREAARARLRLDPGTLAVAYVGRFSVEKNPLAVCQAVRNLPNAVAIMHGFSTDGDNWEQHARAVLPDNRLRIVSREHPVEVTFAAADCLVMASPSEGASLAMVEAMAAGVPVVSTPTGLAADRPELVEPVAFDPSGEVLAKAITRASHSEERTHHAREIAHIEYSAAAMVARWESWIQSLVVTAGK